MKKLIMFAAIAALTSVCSASTVKWNVTQIYGVDSEGKGLTTSESRPAAGQYYVMCFLASNLSLADAQTALANDDISTLAGKATYKGTTTGTALYASSYYDGSWGADQKIDLYAVVFNAATAEGATYAVASTAVTSYTFADSAEDKQVSLNMKTATQGTWTAVNVPEPTSGLMLLLGMAGLALKRKRA